MGSQVDLTEDAICSRCIMNRASDPELVLDANSVCNHCLRYDQLEASRGYQPGKADADLSRIVARIKKAGEGKPYDCVIGVSGGVDSSYVAYISKSLGLRPLAVHLDNGWNAELAVGNIEKLLGTLDIDLHTHVLDWREFRQLQRSFLLGSTPDGEVPTDHAIQALLWETAAKHHVKYILSGMNFATESISVGAWSNGHSDWRYIRSVHAKFENSPLSNYPHYGFLKLMYWNLIRGIRTISILNYVPYNKEAAQLTLEKELGWRRYAGKHYESVYTRFYQGYVLPTKFGIDKRRGHLSDLINSRQIEREEALELISRPDYEGEVLERDRKFVCKKLKFTDEEFQAIMEAPPKKYRDYPNSNAVVQTLRRLVNILRGLELYPK